MTTQARPSLNEQISYSAIIEEPLRASFPGVWEGLYYFDPMRGHNAEQEADNIYTRVRDSFQVIDFRGLCKFNNRILSAVKGGSAVIIPYTLSQRRLAYMMTETGTKPERLREFFGDAALENVEFPRLSRLFEDFAARHETGHGVEILEPGFADYNDETSEPLADGYATLSMFHDYGSVTHDFAKLVIAGRDQQYARNSKKDPVAAGAYLTEYAIQNVLDFVAEQGLETVQAMPHKEIFLHAKRLAAPRRLTV